jgi:hypothetical protein
MTDADVIRRLPAQPSTTDLNLWLVSRLKSEGSELTFGQIASIAKDLSAALSKAEATSAPTPAPVSWEREDAPATECLNCLGGGGYDVPTINGTVWQECDCCNEGEMTEEQERKWLSEWIMGFVEYGDDSEGEPREHELMRRVRWYLLQTTALRTPHGLPGEEELVLLMRQNLSVDVSNYGLSADIEGIEDAARAILSRLSPAEDVK